MVRSFITTVALVNNTRSFGSPSCCWLMSALRRFRPTQSYCMDYCLTVWSCLIETAGSTSRTVSLLSLQQRKSCLPCTAVLRKRHGSLLNWTVPRASAWSNVNGKGWDGLRWFMWKTSLVHDLFCLKLNVPFLRKCYAISRDSKIEFQDIWFSNFRTFDNRNVIRLRYSKTENRKNTTRKRNSCEKKQLC